VKVLPLAAILLACVVSCGKPAEQTESVAGAPPSTLAPAQVQDSTSPEVTLGAGSKLADTGVPAYPGSVVKGEASSPRSGENHITVMLSTPDPLDKVVAFYKEKLKVEASERKGVTVLVGRTKEDANYIVEVSRSGSETKVTVRGIIYAKLEQKS
jgi:hypothetical protein